MLVQCPKCGFTQPKDNYCAKCGVDMENYRPRKTSSPKSFFQNPLFHVLILSGLVYGITYFIQMREKSELRDRISLLRGEKTSISQQIARAKNQVSKDAGQAPETTSDVSNVLKDQQNQNASLNETSSGMTMGTPAENQDSATSSSVDSREIASVKKPSSDRSEDSEYISAFEKIKVQVTYGEAKSLALEKLMEQAQSSGHHQALPEGHFFIINKKTSDLALSPQVLEKISKSFKNDQAPSWFLGSQNPNTGHSLGLTTSVSLEKDENDIISGQIEVLRALPEGESDQVTKKSFIAPFEAYASQTLLMTGILPHNIASNESGDWMKQSLLKVFLSPDYANQRNSFFISFEFIRE